MRTIAPLLLLLLTACTTLTIEEQQHLASYQRNAQLYWDGNLLPQAIAQVDRGLDLSPDDYKLNAMKGALLLRTSGNNPERIDRATEQLAEVYSWRAQYRHDRYLLLYYALAEQKQGLRRLGQAIRADGQASRAVDDEQRRALTNEATDLRTAGEQRLRFADSLLAVLVDKGELLRVVHNHRVQIAQQLGDDELLNASATAYFAKCAEEQQFVKAEIERTEIVDYEDQQLRYLRSLRDEELQVRGLVADWDYRHGRYQQALDHLNRVLEIDPKRSEDYYNRACVLEKLEGVEAARPDFTTFLATTQLPPTSDKYTEAVKALQR
ncbi:MAG: hypothetical protein H6835_21080 [Planctomycetes bacterium]|nr:hypothetical protein [Planctomycetota bacterium]